jgi:hypothetical protein
MNDFKKRKIKKIMRNAVNFNKKKKSFLEAQNLKLKN